MEGLVRESLIVRDDNRGLSVFQSQIAKELVALEEHGQEWILGDNSLEYVTQEMNRSEGHKNSQILSIIKFMNLEW